MWHQRKAFVLVSLVHRQAVSTIKAAAFLAGRCMMGQVQPACGTIFANSGRPSNQINLAHPFIHGAVPLCACTSGQPTSWHPGCVHLTFHPLATHHLNHSALCRWETLFKPTKAFNPRCNSVDGVTHACRHAGMTWTRNTQPGMHRPRFPFNYHPAAASSLVARSFKRKRCSMLARGGTWRMMLQVQEDRCEQQPSAQCAFHSVWMLREMSMAGTLCVSAPMDTNCTPVSAITLRGSRASQQHGISGIAQRAK